MLTNRDPKWELDDAVILNTDYRNPNEMEELLAIGSETLTAETEILRSIDA